MIYFERSFNPELIRSIITHPQIWPHVSDDGSSPVHLYQPPSPEDVVYVIVRDDGEILGLYGLDPHNSICFEIHTCLLPNAWGPRALQAGRAIVDWVFTNTVCRRMITNVPEYNRLALSYAKRVGLVEYGRNPASFLRNGRLWDQILLGVSPREASAPAERKEEEAVCQSV